MSDGSRLNRDAQMILSGGLDSNQRPLAPHTSALPGCATTRQFKIDWAAKLSFSVIFQYQKQPLSSPLNESTH